MVLDSHRIPDIVQWATYLQNFDRSLIHAFTLGVISCLSYQTTSSTFRTLPNDVPKSIMAISRKSWLEIIYKMNIFFKAS